MFGIKNTITRYDTKEQFAFSILVLTQIHIFWRTTKNTAIVQLAIKSGRIRVNSHTLAVIIPVV